jgi:Zn-dependent protease with chaperone function
MKANNYISKIEHKLLLIVALAALIFSIAGSAAYAKKDSDERDEYDRIQAENIVNNEPVFSGAYCHPDKHPQFLFSIILLLGLTFCSLCFAKKYLLSSSLTFASVLMFVYWFINTQKLLSDNESPTIKGLDRLFYKAGDFDIVVCSLVSILLFWQISILLRMLVKTLQTKNELP